MSAPWAIAKIADFGLGRIFGIPMKNFTKEILTLWYRAPEILLGGKNITNKEDVWSLGCILGEMILKRGLF